jgi:predicted secreted protein
MATSGSIAFGVALTLNSEPIAEITNLNGIELSADSVEMTSHDSTDRYREYIQGLRRGGTFDIEGNSLPTDTGQAEITTQFNADAAVSAVITFPNDSNWTADVIVTSYKPADAPVDGALRFTATFQVTGKPVWDDGSA